MDPLAHDQYGAAGAAGDREDARPTPTGVGLPDT
jgi:hypothetical protein